MYKGQNIEINKFGGKKRGEMQRENHAEINKCIHLKININKFKNK